MLPLGKYLEPNETVHHIEGNIENNHESNFAIVDRSIHSKYHHMKVNLRWQPEIWVCSNCNKDFVATSEMVRQRYYNEKRNKGKSGKFCSKRCNGKVNN